MVRFYVFALFMMMYSKPLTGIVTNGPYSNPNSKVIGQSKHSDVKTEEPRFDRKDFVKLTSSEKNVVSEKSGRGIDHAKSLNLTSRQRIFSTASSNFEWRTPLFTKYISTIGTDIKPIYETEINDPKKDFLLDENNGGYHYKRPVTHDNIRTPKKDKQFTEILNENQDLKSAVIVLDRYLKNFLNGDSYNSALHPPINPILALVLSRYGKYTNSESNSGLYSYMATNNMHNNKPFGQYKYAREDYV